MVTSIARRGNVKPLSVDEVLQMMFYQNAQEFESDIDDIFLARLAQSGIVSIHGKAIAKNEKSMIMADHYGDTDQTDIDTSDLIVFTDELANLYNSFGWRILNKSHISWVDLSRQHKPMVYNLSEPLPRVIKYPLEAIVLLSPGDIGPANFPESQIASSLSDLSRQLKEEVTPYFQGLVGRTRLTSFNVNLNQPLSELYTSLNNYLKISQ